MPLIDIASGAEIKEGDEITLGRKVYNVSGLDPKARLVFLFQDFGDSTPFPLPVSAIGAQFRP